MLVLLQFLSNEFQFSENRLSQVTAGISSMMVETNAQYTFTDKIREDETSM